MEEEIWKDIPGYEGLYRVSTLGNVLSVNYAHSGKPGILVQAKNGAGYPTVNLYKNGVLEQCFVHRLVSITFIPNPEGKREVDHIDGNPKNNRVENLRWCTHQENLNNPVSLERFKKGSTGRRHTKEAREKMSKSRIGLAAVPILQISMEDGSVIREFIGTCYAAREYGYDEHKIHRCLRGDTKSAYGYYWRYKDPNRINKKYIRRNKK